MNIYSFNAATIKASALPALMIHSTKISYTLSEVIVATVNQSRGNMGETPTIQYALC